MNTQKTTQEITQEALRKVGTTYALAKMLNVRWQTAQKWRDGVTEPRGKNLLKLLEIAGKSLAVVLLVSCLFAANTNPSYAANSHKNQYDVYYVQLCMWWDAVAGSLPRTRSIR